METWIRERIKRYPRCIRRKSAAKTAPLVPIASTAPLELVCLDYLKLDRSKGGYEDILVVTDHCTRYAQAYPTRNQTAKTTARVLFDNFIVHYGFPARLHSDQDANFMSSLISELCSLAGISKSRTTPYHAMGNGMTDRFNQTLLNMLGTLEEDKKADWKSHVASLVDAYNVTTHPSTGFSPYFLMFGRHPKLALDAFLGLKANDTSSKETHEYIRKLQERLSSAYKKASEAAKATGCSNKEHYDEKATAS